MGCSGHSHLDRSQHAVNQGLAARFAASGLDVTVRETARYFLYGYGMRGKASGASRGQL
jgi:hypothetical protein